MVVEGVVPWGVSFREEIRLSWLRDTFVMASGILRDLFGTRACLVFLQCKDTTFADGNHTITYVAVRFSNFEF